MNSRIRLVSTFVAIALLLPALAQASGTIPAGAKISVVTDQSVSSKSAKAGQTVTGSVAHDVTVDGKVVIPKGSAVKLSVSSEQGSGRLSKTAKNSRQSAQLPEREPEQPARRRRERKTSSFPPKQGWRSPRGRP